jgi:hypothetical protein
MLAASFDLVQEGQVYGSGSWVVFGILSGGIFIWLCKKVLYDPRSSSFRPMPHFDRFLDLDALFLLLL